VSNSGSGRDALNVADLSDPASEPLPDPRERAWRVLREWLSSSNTDGVFAALDEIGLSFCWKPPACGGGS
jgi:hypothetical protein